MAGAGIHARCKIPKQEHNYRTVRVFVAQGNCGYIPGRLAPILVHRPHMTEQRVIEAHLRGYQHYYNLFFCG